jgi:serine protease
MFMCILKPLSFAITFSLLLTSMSMTNPSHADSSIPGDSDDQSIQNQVANEGHRIIVKYRDGAAKSMAAFKTMADRISNSTGRAMTHMHSTGTGAQVFELNETLTTEELQGIIQEIENDPTVEYAEPDILVQPFFTPTDPYYNEQLHYYDDKTGARLPDAWDITQGEGVIVAVVDSGYTKHEDLVGNLQLPGYDMIGDVKLSTDGDGRDKDAFDSGTYDAECKGITQNTWHGTHTSGTVAAVSNNIGVTGVAFKAKVLPVRVLGKCNAGWLSDFSDAIIWAAGGKLKGVPTNKTPAQVINLSLGAEKKTCSNTMQNAIHQARGLGATVVVSAGNENKNASGVEPGNCDGVINVASIDKKGNRAKFSNYGDVVDIAAPGVGILSTYNSGTTEFGSDNYMYMDGTSMSAPHVSGVAALLYSAKPDITPDEVEQVLKDTARPFPGKCDGCGAGLLDAAAAVKAVSSQ